MMMIAEGVVAALLVVSGLFGLIGSYGLLKLPDPMMRLHAPTKATTVGVGAALVAAILWRWVDQGQFGLGELLLTLFLLLTAPITGQMLAKLHIHQGKPPLPAPSGETTPPASR